AAKLQSLAEANEIVIGDQMHRLLGEFVTAEDMGLREVGSGLAAQHSWRVTGYSERRGRLNLASHGVSAPLVGRSAEKAVVSQAWHEAKAGETRVLLISGEPGIGKSRLMQHLVSITPKECRRGLAFFCSSYHQSTAFHPITDQLRRICGITFRDRPEQRADKARELVRIARARGLPDRLLPLYEALIVGDTGKTLDMTPEERKARTITTLHKLVAVRSQQQPVVLLCEDLQWCDPSTLATMDHLVRKVRDLPCLFAFSYRPEFDCPWEDLDQSRVIKLDRFGQREATCLLRGVAAGKRLPEELELNLLDKTDGIPLFIEEITRNLLASGALVEHEDRFEQVDPSLEINIPATLNEALMTRIDRMSDVREVTLWAAALGRRFAFDQLEAVAPFSRQELYRALGQLCSTDLLAKRGILGQDIYEFRHALVRETAYNSMLASKKKRIHSAIVQGLTRLDPEISTRQPDIIYHHLLMSGDLPGALEAATAAGDQIAQRYKGPETRHHYQAAFNIVEKLPEGEETDRLRLKAIIKLATSASKPAEIEADLARLATAESLAERFDNLPRRVQCLYWAARLKFDRGDELGAIELAERGAELARPTGDVKMRSSPENLLGFLYSLRGYPAKGIALTERNSEDLALLGDRREATVMTGIFAFALGSGGYFDRADQVSATAVAMAEDLGHGQSLAVATFARATVLAWAGRMEDAAHWTERAFAAADASNNRFQRFVTHGWAGEAFLHHARMSGDPLAGVDALHHLTRWAIERPHSCWRRSASASAALSSTPAASGSWLSSSAWARSARNAERWKPRRIRSAISTARVRWWSASTPARGSPLIRAWCKKASPAQPWVTKRWKRLFEASAAAKARSVQWAASSI
ncbi:MAG: AAA family ATPase, partial [Pseudomonadota bacterium]